MALKYEKEVDLDLQNQMNLLPDIKKILKSFPFNTKIALVQSITGIELLTFLTNTAPQNFYFIVHYHFFLRKKE